MDGLPATAVLHKVSLQGVKVEEPMKEYYCKNRNTCRRKILLQHFDPSYEQTSKCMCCDICALICECTINVLNLSALPWIIIWLPIEMTTLGWSNINSDTKLLTHPLSQILKWKTPHCVGCEVGKILLSPTSELSWSCLMMQLRSFAWASRTPRGEGENTSGDKHQVLKFLWNVEVLDVIILSATTSLGVAERRDLVASKYHDSLYFAYGWHFSFLLSLCYRATGVTPPNTSGLQD